MSNALDRQEESEADADSTAVGEPMGRREDDRLLRGEGKYMDDFEPTSNLHHVAFLRSPVAHGEIDDIDTTAAERREDVTCVLTGADIAEQMDPFAVGVQNPPEYYPLAVDKVRYDGEPVAMVVATTKYGATDALEDIVVDYTRLDPVTDELEALDDDSPQIHPSGNCANYRELEYGPVDEAFERADHVVEREFEFPRYTSAPMETYGVIAEYDTARDGATVWSNFQGPFTMHPVVAGALGMSEADLQFKVPSDSGGSFGVKAHIYPYIAAAVIASREAGAPVKWIESRREHLQASACHTDRTQRMRGAVSEEGDILGVWVDLYDNFGAYVRAPEPGNTFRPLGNYVNAYDFDAFGGEFRAVQTNKCPAGLNRGYGCHQYYFGLERLIDCMADVVGMDPTAFRERNFIDEDEFPYRTPTGGEYDSGRYSKALQRAKELFEYEDYLGRRDRARANNRYIGIGCAAIIDPSASNMGYVSVALPPEEREKGHPKSGAVSAVTMMVQPDASIVVELDSAPSGQGHETTASQIAADELGVDPEAITVVSGMDTSEKAWSVSSGSYSSRFATVGHSAVKNASEQIAEQMRRIAAVILDVDPVMISLEDGRAHGPDGGAISIREIAGTAHWNPSKLPDNIEPGLRTQHTFSMDDSRPIDEDDRINSSGSYGYGVQLVAVEVNKTTGEIDILDYVAVHDCGTIVNPKIVDGQVEGGIFHGLAGSLYEELRYDDSGTLQTDTFMDYAVPTAKEAPDVTTDHIETPSPKTPMGSKGTGEAGTEGAPAAIANAVNDALDPLGVEITSLPLKPPRVWSLIEEAEGEKSSD
ncbi:MULTISPECIES: xanthine dehydrogenase family protein molybdopterin-binding subunit [Halobaculum]|uniref:Xanthine dehydrogenase family protein molybdopterin-binding subunit n=2 Tax=Halobaculum TaxID=43927 RepID=A0A8T8WH41_9EURY|nr:MULTISPECIES: xanthine dehydrogenase family protein molybdopterin-binding subunit [Halobaculum]QZP39167.1 xanthine dehydrogenase family protein molybdopterin-binding subunit [Halobaculum magnesiiphilum]QZY04197.1 xanthine dehydrogenase family protein molybdopterin-binding subunit [Halobaculum roseum]